VALSASDVGSRVVVRRLLPGERGPSGGPAMSDVIGVLEEYDADHLVVRRKDDSTVRIAQDVVVAAKTVPPPPTPRTDTDTGPRSEGV
jgi:N-acetylglutamate synthase